jgi:viroplasmin and RNaseH domain-containing protein
VCATEVELEQQVHGFPDSCYKIFVTKQDAQDWLRLELASYVATDNIRASKDNNRGNNEPRGNKRPTITDQNRHQESVTGPARIHGEDSSKGEAEKIYGASIYTGEAVKLLSPPNSSTETMEDLMEAVPDVTSPGKLVDSASEANEQMANSLQALAEQNAQRTNVMMKDTQWKNKARSALSKVRSMETLVELYKEVDEQQLKVGELAKHAVAEILRRACWPETLIEQCLETGGIVRLIERSQFLWMQLLLHFQKLQKGTDQWESTAQLHVEHFTKKLLLMRKHAPTRSIMVQEVCCFLRDEAVKRFMSLALLSRVTEHVQTRLLIDANKPSDAIPGDPATKTKSQRCSHCHSSSIHEGGTYITVS